MPQGEPEQLLKQATAGDRDALQQLLFDHFDRLLRHIQFRLGPNESKLADDDVLQDTFTHAIRDIQTCQATTQLAFFAWLKSIADNRVRDSFKKLNTKKRGGDRVQLRAVTSPDDSTLIPLIELLHESIDTPSVDAASGEAIRAMQLALAGLPEDQQTAIQLRLLDGLDLGEVATRMDKTEAAVRGLIHRGKQELSDTMGNSSRWFSKKQ